MRNHCLRPAFTIACCCRGFTMASYPDAADRPDTPRNRGDDRRAAPEPGHPGRGPADHPAQRDRLGCRAGRRRGRPGHPAAAQHAGARDRDRDLGPRHRRQSECHLLVGRRRHLVDAVGHHRLAGRRLCGRAAVGPAEGGHRRLARPHRLGLHHAGDLLPAQLDRGRRARWRLQHGQRRARRDGPHGGSERLLPPHRAWRRSPIRSRRSRARCATPPAATIRQPCGTPRSPRSARRSPVIRRRRNKHASGPRRRWPARRTSRSRRLSAKSPATSSSTGRRSTRHGSRQPRPPTPPHGWSRAGRCSASSPWRWAHWRHGSVGVRARSIRP